MPKSTSILTNPPVRPSPYQRPSVTRRSSWSSSIERVVTRSQKIKSIIKETTVGLNKKRSRSHDDDEEEKEEGFEQEVVVSKKKNKTIHSAVAEPATKATKRTRSVIEDEEEETCEPNISKRAKTTKMSKEMERDVKPVRGAKKTTTVEKKKKRSLREPTTKSAEKSKGTKIDIKEELETTRPIASASNSKKKLSPKYDDGLQTLSDEEDAEEEAAAAAALLDSTSEEEEAESQCTTLVALSSSYHHSTPSLVGGSSSDETDSEDEEEDSGYFSSMLQRQNTRRLAPSSSTSSSNTRTYKRAHSFTSGTTIHTTMGKYSATISGFESDDEEGDEAWEMAKGLFGEMSRAYGVEPFETRNSVRRGSRRGRTSNARDEERGDEASQGSSRSRFSEVSD